jgi:hypothetical protein
MPDAKRRTPCGHDGMNGQAEHLSLNLDYSRVEVAADARRWVSRPGGIIFHE